MMQGLREGWNAVMNLAAESGFAALNWKSSVMLLLALIFLYLAIVRKFEPLLLTPIAFGMLLTNLPAAELYHPELWQANALTGGLNYNRIFTEGGLLDLLYIGIRSELFPPLIFLGIGAMTDFSPLIANPKSLLLGAAAQGGIFLTFLGAALLGFTAPECGAIAIIGGADGPTSIYVSTKLLSAGSFRISTGTVALAAYTYMALVPVIQPPLMRLFTTKQERMVRMEQLRPVSRTEKLCFPLLVCIVTALLVPSAAVLVGMLMLGNLLKESGVCERLVKTISGGMMNAITVLLGLGVGATAQADKILTLAFAEVLLLGILAFAAGTVCGLLLGKLMYVLSGGKVNPLIGAAGVSAVPMAARTVEQCGVKENPENHLLMYAMGPNVAGVIGSAVAAGILLAVLQ